MDNLSQQQIMLLEKLNQRIFTIQEVDAFPNDEDIAFRQLVKNGLVEGYDIGSHYKYHATCPHKYKITDVGKAAVEHYHDEQDRRRQEKANFDKTLQTAHDANDIARSAKKWSFIISTASTLIALAALFVAIFK